MGNDLKDGFLPNQWIQNMLQLGIVAPIDQRNLYEVAKKCSKQVGLPLAGGGFVMGGPKGALAGLLLGTLTCTSINYSLKQQISQLARDLK